MKKIIIIFTSLVVIATAYNLSHFINYRNSKNLTFDDFIRENTEKKLITNSKFNLFFVVSPLDCQSCSEYLLSMDFINSLKGGINRKKKSISINYVVTGDYTEEEKID